MRPLILPASAFSDVLLQRTITAIAFAGVEMEAYDTTTRGRIISRVVRGVDGQRHKGATFEEPEGCREVVNGRRHGAAPYGWRRDGVRVACRSAQLVWDRSNGRWGLGFQRVQLQNTAVGPARRDAALDELLLAAYTPRGLYVFEHDLRTGLARLGTSSATGLGINVYGPHIHVHRPGRKHIHRPGPARPYAYTCT